MSATAEDEPIHAPPQPPSPLPDEPFFAPVIVDGIDPDQPSTTLPAANEKLTDLFTSFSARMTDAVRSVRLPVARMPSPPAIIFFGDSITERASAVRAEGAPGWVSLLAEDFAGKADLFPKGFSGYNTRWALYIFPRVVDALPSTANIRLVLIFFGANDACIEPEPQYVPLEQYVQNLRTLVSHVRSIRRANPVVPMLVAPPPVQEDHDDSNPNRLAARTAKYAAACVALAKEVGCPYVDMHTEMLDKVRADGVALGDEQTGLHKYLCDGLHLSAEGNKLVYDAIVKTIRTQLPDIAPENLKRPFPEWREVDPDKPADALGYSPLV